MAVDAQGNAYITGSTQSSDFPVTSGFSGPLPSGAAVPFVVKLNPAGEVVYATLFAGAASASPTGIAVDGGGNVVITGTTAPGYPVTAGALSSSATNDVPFVTKLDPTGTKLVFSATGVGGGQVALGPQGDIFLAGNTISASYPTTPGAFQTTFTPDYHGKMPAHFLFLALGHQPQQFFFVRMKELATLARDLLGCVRGSHPYEWIGRPQASD